MKVAFAAVALAALVAAEVTVDFDKLQKSSTVKFNKEKCGDWKKYTCCSSKEQCKGLKEGKKKDKKEQKKAEKERDHHCVPEEESCCGADITVNWQESDKNSMEHDTKKGKNNKGCDDDEECVISHVLSHSDSKKKTGSVDDSNYLKILVGKKAKTSCMKKTSYDKKAESAQKKFDKDEIDEDRKAEKEFVKDTKIVEIFDGSHKCGDFDNTWKCCNPDKHFCDSIAPADKEKYCTEKKNECCANFKYQANDRSIIELTSDVHKNSCDHDSDKKYCVVKSHTKKSRKVSTTCVEKKIAENNKYRKKKKGGGDSPFGDIADFMQMQGR